MPTNTTETIEIDANLAHRAWGFLDLASKSGDIQTYPADDKARIHLAEQLIEAGLLTEDRL